MSGAANDTTGTLYGLGVGPGDPELLTLKAARILGEVPVLAYITPEGGDSLARRIAAPHLSGGQAEIAIPIAMKTDPGPGQKVYDEYAVKLDAHLQAGRSVAVLCEGDPFFYGSFMYLYGRLWNRCPVQVVPGVSSLMAVPAVAGLPLVSRDQVLTVIPATLDEATLEAQLMNPGPAVLMKVGRHLGKVKTVLERLGLLKAAVFIEKATQEGERVLPLATVDADAKGGALYFSMILVGKP
ncbi:MAG: precorrin-2 C(20)-methyltransferase [Rhodospirillales bacterium]|nr:precorrin-2 C(20)-methyltransferase [Rhodospirillales bacterium]